jgi:5-hydroxyisourate hydrolase-like protein (transthyretin family)
MTLAEFTRQLNLLTHIVEANGKSTDDIQVVVRINDDTSFYVVSLGTDEDGDVAIDY